MHNPPEPDPCLVSLRKPDGSLHPSDGAWRVARMCPLECGKACKRYDGGEGALVQRVTWLLQQVLGLQCETCENRMSCGLTIAPLCRLRDDALLNFIRQWANHPDEHEALEQIRAAILNRLP